MIFFPVTTSGFKYSLLIAEFKYPHPRDENKDQIPEGGETKIDQIPHICPPPLWDLTLIGALYLHTD
jgi:hypothetical protein